MDMGVVCLAWAEPRPSPSYTAGPALWLPSSAFCLWDDSTHSPSTERQETGHPPGGSPQRPELGSGAQSWEHSRGEEGLGLGW